MEVYFLILLSPIFYVFGRVITTRFYTKKLNESFYVYHRTLKLAYNMLLDGKYGSARELLSMTLSILENNEDEVNE